MKVSVAALQSLTPPSTHAPRCHPAARRLRPAWPDLHEGHAPLRDHGDQARPRGHVRFPARDPDPRRRPLPGIPVYQAGPEVR
eukprot:scaffold93680_cov72-Phaeocystis_antarctica.AAC.2